MIFPEMVGLTCLFGVARMPGRPKSSAERIYAAYGGREKAGWKRRERERQWGVEKAGKGRGDLVGSRPASGRRL